MVMLSGRRLGVSGRGRVLGAGRVHTPTVKAVVSNSVA